MSGHGGPWRALAPWGLGMAAAYAGMQVMNVAMARRLSIDSLATVGTLLIGAAIAPAVELMARLVKPRLAAILFSALVYPLVLCLLSVLLTPPEALHRWRSTLAIWAMGTLWFLVYGALLTWYRSRAEAE